ncbi:MAG: SRPBCC family protein [Acidimicrobiia bacterium]|nr:SRPBCC family protein [Acidimicrobiia bacterium]
MAETVRFERSHDIVIEAPPAEVLDYVSNPNTWPEWMPATHHIDSPDRPLQAGDRFAERWGTSGGEVQLDWRVVEREDARLWVAEADTAFIGRIVARYTTEETPAGTRYTRTVVNPSRPKAPTEEMVLRIDAEAAVCLANIKAAVERRRSTVRP